MTGNAVTSVPSMALTTKGAAITFVKHRAQPTSICVHERQVEHRTLGGSPTQQGAGCNNRKLPAMQETNCQVVALVGTQFPYLNSMFRAVFCSSWHSNRCTNSYGIGRAFRERTETDFDVTSDNFNV